MQVIYSKQRVVGDAGAIRAEAWGGTRGTLSLSSRNSATPCRTRRQLDAVVAGAGALSPKVERESGGFRDVVTIVT